MDISTGIRRFAKVLTGSAVVANLLLSAALAQSIPPISHDISALPEPVQETRQRIMEAARSGDIERLRPVLEMNELPPSFSFGPETDAIEFWRTASGDGEGREILATMLEVLEAGYAHTGAGTDHEMFVWPYFYAVPLDGLTPEQEVELYRLISPDEHEQMQEFGGYLHFRLGIGPDGTWHFFVAGD